VSVMHFTMRDDINQMELVIIDTGKALAVP
jgi:hypothetical protein